jgi:hypothetical protein
MCSGVTHSMLRRPAERPADPLLRADHLREHREIGVDVVAPSSAISDDPESFRAGLIRFFQAMGVGIFRIVSVHPAELRDL